MSGKPLSWGVTPRRRRIATFRGDVPKSCTDPPSQPRKPSAISSAVAVGAEQRDDLASIDLERERLERARPSVGFADVIEP
ncbi:MAG: hypothetical protein WB681_00110 [Candidatus Cybelea sp.]